MEKTFNKHFTSCLIVKNEGERIEKLVRSLLRFSDEVFITDTGSTDGTLKILDLMIDELEDKSRLKVFQYKWTNDFGAARTYSFSHSSKYNSENDYFFWCDGDDELTEELIDWLNEFKLSSNEVQHSEILLDYFYPKVGKSGKFVTYRNSIFRKHDYHNWIGVVHEVPEVSSNYPTKFIEPTSGCYLIHNQSMEGRDLNRNIKIFTNKYVEKGFDSFSVRDLFYYGFELYSNDKNFLWVFDELFRRGTNVYEPGWTSYYFNTAIACAATYCIDNHEEERAYTYLSLYEKFSDFVRVDVAYQFGRYFHSIKNYDKALKFYQIASQKSNINYIDSTFSNEEEYPEYALAGMMIVYYDLDDLKSSLDVFNLLKDKYPESHFVKANQKYYDEVAKTTLS